MIATRPQCRRLRSSLVLVSPPVRGRGVRAADAALGTVSRARVEELVRAGRTGASALRCWSSPTGPGTSTCCCCSGWAAS